MAYLSILAGEHDELLGWSITGGARRLRRKAGRLASRVHQAATPSFVPKPFRKALDPFTAQKIAMNIGRRTHKLHMTGRGFAKKYAPRSPLAQRISAATARFQPQTLTGEAEYFQMLGADTDELLGRSFLSRMGSRVKKTVKTAGKVVKGTVLAPYKLATRPVKTVKEAMRFTARNPFTTTIMTGGLAAPLLLTTKKGRGVITSTAGNVAAYGLAPVTGGASLLGKKKVRKFAKRHPWMTAAISPASLVFTMGTKQGRREAARPIKQATHVVANVGRGVGHFVAQTAREIAKQEKPEDTQESGAPGPEDSGAPKKSNLALPVGLGLALSMLL